MKNLFLYVMLFLIADSVYSQSPCAAVLDYTVTGDSTTCEYTFTPDTSMTPKHICSITWEIASYGGLGVACDPSPVPGNPLTKTFCFNGYYDIKMIINFCDGSSCYVLHTVYVRCLGADECDPDPYRTTSITDPKVEITYIQPDTCNYNAHNAFASCMSSLNGLGNYYIACAWRWAIRIPPSNCIVYDYYVQYDSITSCGNYTCVQRILTDTNFICIDAYINQPIYIVATANHCCLPANYTRGYYWTPVPSTGTLTTISDPNPTVSTLCTAYRNCPNYTYCVTNPITMSYTSGWPATCFTGGQHIEQRDYLKWNGNFSREQKVIIYNLQGKELFNGIWKFGDPGDFLLKWPGNIQFGLYLVKFEGEKLTKLFKFN